MILRVETIEDDAIDSNGDGLYHNLDDDAHQAPVLQSADEVVLNFLLEEALALIVDAGPSPHVLIVGVVLRALKNSGGNAPHDKADNEEAHGKSRVVHRRLLGASVSAFPV